MTDICARSTAPAVISVLSTELSGSNADVIASSSPFGNPSTNDFSVSTEAKEQGFPQLVNGSITTNFQDVGAAQREEPTGGGSAQTSYGYFC